MALTFVTEHVDSLIKIFQLGKSILDFGEQAFNIVRATVKWFTSHHQEYYRALLDLKHYYRGRDCMSIPPQRRYESTMVPRPLLTIFTVRLTPTIQNRMRRLDEIRPQTDFDLYDAYVQAHSQSLPYRQPLLPDAYSQTHSRSHRQPLLLPSAPESDSDSDSDSDSNTRTEPCNAPSWYKGSNIAWAAEMGYATDGDGNVM
jgi:hypothetical protein